MEKETGQFDNGKLILASGIVLAGLIAFYALPQVSLLFRVIGLVGAFVVAVLVFFTTERGKVVANFLQEARVELRKMIWPTKVETGQTTLIVIVAVIVVAIFLWGLDLILRALMSMVIQ